MGWTPTAPGDSHRSGAACRAISPRRGERPPYRRHINFGSVGLHTARSQIPPGRRPGQRPTPSSLWSRTTAGSRSRMSAAFSSAALLGGELSYVSVRRDLAALAVRTDSHAAVRLRVDATPTSECPTNWPLVRQRRVGLSQFPTCRFG
jgi:hypothetical protein